jgi:hypothetical protein
MLTYMYMIFYCTCGPTVKFQDFICKDTYAGNQNKIVCFLQGNLPRQHQQRSVDYFCKVAQKQSLKVTKGTALLSDHIIFNVIKITKSSFRVFIYLFLLLGTRKNLGGVRSGGKMGE